MVKSIAFSFETSYITFCIYYTIFTFAHKKAHSGEWAFCLAFSRAKPSLPKLKTEKST